MPIPVEHKMARIRLQAVRPRRHRLRRQVGEERLEP